MAQYSVSVLGAGRVGSTLAVALARRGYALRQVISRQRKVAEGVVAMAGAGRACDDYRQIQDVDVLFLTVSDGAIESTAQELASHLHPPKVVCHCSGALSSTVLHALKEKGCWTASAHPLQSFAQVDTALKSLPGTRWALEGHPQAVDMLSVVVRDLKGVPLTIATERKTEYHAAAVMACNYFVSLVSLSTQLLERAGVPREEGLRALLPLIQGTVDNMATVGIPQALTGPISRGDVSTVDRHLQAIGSDPLVDGVYRLLATEAVHLASAQANPPAKEKADTLLQLLTQAQKR
eukprot:comp19589_c0_seq1/m.23046 comp19589_c0_seq1/g.23046  ORF comp19589_c0_seq1/g.23046 comp19589_c0_seq1/m.23046 type:complete len:293 (-) comp19589_c0_seq1:423-1301(-)